MIFWVLPLKLRVMQRIFIFFSVVIGAEFVSLDDLYKAVEISLNFRQL